VSELKPHLSRYLKEFEASVFGVPMPDIFSLRTAYHEPLTDWLSLLSTRKCVRVRKISA